MVLEYVAKLLLCTSGGHVNALILRLRGHSCVVLAYDLTNHSFIMRWLCRWTVRYLVLSFFIAYCI